MDQNLQNRSSAEDEKAAKKTGNKWTAGILGGLFALSAVAFTATELPYQVPALIENNHNDAARAIVEYLPHPFYARPTERSLEAALFKNKFALAAFIADHDTDSYDLAEAANSLGRAEARNAGADEIKGLRLLLSKGLNKNVGYMEEDANRSASSGDLERLKLFIEFGAPVTGHVLANAASAKSTNTLQYLLSHYTFADADKQEALVYSLSFYGNADAFDLLRAQVKPDRETQGKMLDEAVSQDNLKVLQYLLKTYSFDPDTKAKALESALKRSAHPETSGYLMDHGGIPRAAQIEAVREALHDQSPASLNLADRLVELQGGPKAPVPTLALP